MTDGEIDGDAEVAGAEVDGLVDPDLLGLAGGWLVETVGDGLVEAAVGVGVVDVASDAVGVGVGCADDELDAGTTGCGMRCGAALEPGSGRIRK